MRTVTPEAIASTLKDQFNIDMDIYLVVKHSAKALELMGMIATHKEVLMGLVENYCIKVPPEVVKITSVICTSKPVDESWKYEIQDIPAEHRLGSHRKCNQAGPDLRHCQGG